MFDSRVDIDGPDRPPGNGRNHLWTAILFPGKAVALWPWRRIRSGPDGVGFENPTTFAVALGGDPDGVGHGVGQGVTRTQLLLAFSLPFFLPFSLPPLPLLPPSLPSPCACGGENFLASGVLGSGVGWVGNQWRRRGSDPDGVGSAQILNPTTFAWRRGGDPDGVGSGGLRERERWSP